LATSGGDAGAGDADGRGELCRAVCGVVGAGVARAKRRRAGRLYARRAGGVGVGVDARVRLGADAGSGGFGLLESCRSHMERRAFLLSSFAALPAAVATAPSAAILEAALADEQGWSRLEYLCFQIGHRLSGGEG